MPTQRKTLIGSSRLKSGKFFSLSVFALIVLFGVLGRYLFLDLPNFTPITAVAVFAGLYFTSRTLALSAPLAVMVISNYCRFGGYSSWGELVFVFAAVLFPVFLTRRLRNSDGQRYRLSLLGTGTCAVVPSLVFFVSTNFAVWLFNGWYEHTIAGLVKCFALAVPFYKYSLCGDLTFVTCAIVAYELGFAIAANRQRPVIAGDLP